jgi:hypothetical protein
VVAVAELTPAQQAELDAHVAKQNRAYVREHSDTIEELREAEQALREKGFDPGTGLPQ